MGITGTKVAQNASDIVITDDKFSSIVSAILWGRSVYDNIRRFLQFQLTVNVVALTITFIGSVSGFPPPLNAVMMLWVNLIMDTMGALALGTEKPTSALLKRQPYKRDAPLVSRPMWRNILVQSAYQLALLLVLLFMGAELFDVRPGDMCLNFKIANGGTDYDLSGKAATIPWLRNNDDPADYQGGVVLPNPMLTDAKKFHDEGTGELLEKYGECRDFNLVCPEEENGECYDAHFKTGLLSSKFDLNCFDSCAKTDFDYTHFSIIFNSFVWCQVFNEFNARSIKNDPNILRGLGQSRMFLGVIFVTGLFQYLIIAFGGDWVRTTNLSGSQWLWSVAFGAVSLPVGVIMRFIPVWQEEDPDSWFGYTMPG